MDKFYDDRSKKLFYIIREELNDFDPLGVIKNNPTLVDEYDMENKLIISVLNNYSDYKEFAEKICEIFISTTGEKVRVEDGYKCAKNILEKVKPYK